MTFKYLISEDGTAISLGRIGFWITFGIHIYFWFCVAPDKIPASLTNVFEVMLAYNFGKKLITPFSNYLNQKSGTKDE